MSRLQQTIPIDLWKKVIFCSKLSFIDRVSLIETFKIRFINAEYVNELKRLIREHFIRLINAHIREHILPTLSQAAKKFILEHHAVLSGSYLFVLFYASDNTIIKGKVEKFLFKPGDVDLFFIADPDLDYGDFIDLDIQQQTVYQVMDKWNERLVELNIAQKSNKSLDQQAQAQRYLDLMIWCIDLQKLDKKPNHRIPPVVMNAAFRNAKGTLFEEEEEEENWESHPKTIWDIIRTFTVSFMRSGYDLRDQKLISFVSMESLLSRTFVENVDNYLFDCKSHFYTSSKNSFLPLLLRSLIKYRERKLQISSNIPEYCLVVLASHLHRSAFTYIPRRQKKEDLHDINSLKSLLYQMEQYFGNCKDTIDLCRFRSTMLAMPLYDRRLKYDFRQHYTSNNVKKIEGPSISIVQTEKASKKRSFEVYM